MIKFIGVGAVLSTPISIGIFGPNALGTNTPTGDNPAPSSNLGGIGLLPSTRQCRLPAAGSPSWLKQIEFILIDIYYLHSAMVPYL